MKHQSHSSSSAVQHSKPLVPGALALVAGLFLSACGGGGGGAAPDIPVVIQAAPMADVSGERWSDPATWGGEVPVAGSMVEIPEGKRVLLDTNLDVAGITVGGELICDSRDINIRTRFIMVHGLLQCGTEAAPYLHRLDVTLTGNDRNESIMGMGTKMITAMDGGIISLHGEERTSWLMLGQTAHSGDRSIRTEYATNWRSGDIIVIASTDDNMHHAEIRQIDRIEGDRVFFDNPLQHRHYGEMQWFSNERRSWQLDTRAEVGLLTRNIRIHGDEQSEQNGFGGHMMVMEGSAAFIAGIELYRMGQTGILARYPFHWHMANNVAGQYIRNSSISRSFSRCVTVHGTHNAQVADNVCFDHLGHGFFLEDGVETGNVFDHNLGLITRRPDEDVALLPSDRLEGQAAKGPSTFWISNGDNTFTNNAAAGSDGLGFWYDTPDTPSGLSAGYKRYRNVSPVNSPFKVFRDNRVHSSRMAFSSCSRVSGPIGYTPLNQAVYENLTVFAGGDAAVWPCHGNQFFLNLKISDTGVAHHGGFIAPRPLTVAESLFVANSGLSEGGRGRMRTAVEIYDFGVDIRNSHFVNFDNEYGPSYVFGPRESDVRFTNNPVSGLTFQNSPFFYDRRKNWMDLRPSQWGATIHDEDGSFGMGPGTALVADHPMMSDSTCTDLVGTGRLCQNRYGRLEMDFGLRNLPPMTHHRSDGVTAIAQPLAERRHYQSIVSVNHARYYYGYEFDQTVLNDSRSMTLSMNYLHDGDTVVVEFKNLPTSAAVTTKWPVAANLNDLIFGDGNRQFRQGNSYFLKLRADGDHWQAGNVVGIKW